jgi:hypothetical protein
VFWCVRGGFALDSLGRFLSTGGLSTAGGRTILRFVRPQADYFDHWVTFLCHRIVRRLTDYLREIVRR